MTMPRLALLLVLLVAAAAAGCGHAPDGRTVQQAVDDTVRGAPAGP